MAARGAFGCANMTTRMLRWPVARAVSGSSGRSQSSLLLVGVAAVMVATFAAYVAQFNTVSAYLWTLNLCLVITVFIQHIRGSYHLVSLRNAFLLGFMLFQTQSVADAIHRDAYGGLVIGDAAAAGAEFSAMATAFLVVFFTVYSRRSADIPRLSRAARRTPLASSRQWPVGQCIAPAVLTIVALTLKYVGNNVDLPALQNALWILAVGTSAAAVGILGWRWVRLPSNVIMLGFGAAIVGLNAFTAVGGVFGRRPLVNVLASLLWAIYYSRLRIFRPLRSFAVLLLLGLPPLLLFLAYTSVRDPAEHQRTSTEQLRAMQESGDLAAGLTELRDKEISGAFSLWAIENFGKVEPIRPLLTVRYIAALPVPRQVWPGKPEPLSSDFARIAGVPGVSADRITIPAGLIGTAAAEGGWYAVVLYAVGLALMLSACDRLALRYRENFAVIVPLGVALGEVVGFARGETSVFVVLFVLYAIGSWGVIRLFAAGPFFRHVSRVGLAGNLADANHIATSRSVVSK